MTPRDYKAGAVELYLGDCRDIAPALQGVDAVITDPPYGMGWNTNSKRFNGGRHKQGTGRENYGPIAGDHEPFDPTPWLNYPRVVLWGFNHFAARLPVGTTLVWLKKNEHLWGTFLSDAELGWMRGGYGVYARRISFPPPVRAKDAGGNSSRPFGIHPTQKPVDLMIWCMARAKVPVGATVLDPYMGSGTTAIACMRTGRRFVGIEKDPKHFETARQRIERELAKSS